MKLIIEIDNEAYKGLVTDGHIFVKHIFDSVKNGIPLDKIRAEIEHEADYQDAYVNADIAKGMYLALEIFDKYKGGDNK